MVNPCFADRYQEYMLAARLTRMALVRTLTELSDVGERVEMTLYRFDPKEMLAFADDLRRAGTAAGAASLSLLVVPTDGLPPEAKGLVEGQSRALWRLLFQAESVLTDGARYLARMSAAVGKADHPTLRAAGLDLVRVTKAGEIIIKQLSDVATGTDLR